MPPKTSGTAVILVGHITKEEGSVLGQKILEHLVDVGAEYEGDRYGGFSRIVQAQKNRYGSTNEAAIFMRWTSRDRVKNPSGFWRASDGSIVLATMEGARPLLVKIELVNPTEILAIP